MFKHDMQDNASTHPLAIFVDFDGTLVPIAERPEQVVVPPQLSGDLRKLEGELGGAFAIITGRPLDVVDQFLTPAQFATAAAHGTERRRSDGTEVPPSPALIEASKHIHRLMLPFAQAEPRLVLEAKQAAVALHYRQAPELAEICRKTMENAVRSVDGFTLVAGKMVLEARPAAIDKGTAIEAFMREAPFRGRLPVFIGDDTTDEDGFAVVAALGGYGIKVGTGATAARYRLADVAAVQALLRRISEDGPSAERLAPRLAELELEGTP